MKLPKKYSLFVRGLSFNMHLTSDNNIIRIIIIVSCHYYKLMFHLITGDVYAWHTSLSSSPLYHCHCEESIKSVTVATSDLPTFAAISGHQLQVHMSDSNGCWMCIESRNYENRVR